MNFVLHITDNSDKVMQELEKNIGAALEAVGYAAEANVKLLTPVATDNLRSSIGHYVDGNNVVIGTGVRYGKYVEYDDNKTHTNGQAHFLRDGLQDNIKDYEDLLRDYLTK